MKRTLILLLLVLPVAIPSLADEKVRRTVIVKDGKILTEGVLPDGMDFILGGPRAFLGVTLTDVTPELREHFGAPRDAGVMVGAVEKGSPAEKAGARTGDIIVSIDGRNVSTSWEVRRALREKKQGDSVRLEVLRDGSRQALVASLVERDAPGLQRLKDLDGPLGAVMSSPEWRGRIATLGGNCDELHSRIKALESRLKDLEKRLQK